jgi:hypothetical protein
MKSKIEENQKQYESILSRVTSLLRDTQTGSEEEFTDAQLKRRFNADLKRAASLISIDETNFLIGSYYQLQDFRIATANQVRSLELDGEPNELIRYVGESIGAIENQVKTVMGEFAKQYAIGAWLQSITGIGPVLSAAFLTTFSVLHRRTSGAWYQFAGIHPDVSWKKGEKRPFNADAKVFCFKAGECFVKVQNNDKDFYGKLYSSQKEYYQQVNLEGGFAEAAKSKLEKYNIGENTDAYKAYSSGQLPKAHIHSMARRYAVKIFLSHLHDLCWEDYYGEKAPCPYVFSTKFTGGVHRHFIEPPNREALVGKPLIDLFGTEEEDLERKRLKQERRKKNKDKDK